MVKKLEDSAAKGDLQGVEQALKDLQRTVGPVASKSRKAKIEDPKLQRKVTDTLQDLDSLLGQQYVRRYYRLC